MEILCILVILNVIITLNRYEKFYYDGYKMPILIISLPGSPRREKMMKRFENYKGKVIFIDGVYIKSEDDRKRWMDILGLDYSTISKLLGGNGELGCALAHVSAYKYMIDNNIQRALILEDDAVPRYSDSIQDIENYKLEKERDEPSIKFIAGLNMYGLVAQIVTLQGAKQLYKHRKELITLAPIDLVIWEKMIPIDYVKGEPMFKHEDIINQAKTSERIRINEGTLNRSS